MPDVLRVRCAGYEGMPPCDWKILLAADAGWRYDNCPKCLGMIKVEVVRAPEE